MVPTTAPAKDFATKKNDWERLQPTLVFCNFFYYVSAVSFFGLTDHLQKVFELLQFRSHFFSYTKEQFAAVLAHCPPYYQIAC